MSTPYDHKALWLKAELFLNHAMDDPELRTFDERALWASLGLESLAKAALARQSPLLIAVPSEEGTNVLIALGLVAGEARFESIPANSVYKRCERAFRPFSRSEAQKMSWARNEYLHGTAAIFTRMPESAWWPKYWAQASILVTACEKEIEDLVGSQRASMVQGYLEQNKMHIEHRYEALISRAQQRRAQHEAGTLPVNVAQEWQPGPAPTVDLGYKQDETCPACHQVGVVEGSAVTDVEHEIERISDGDYDIFVTLTVGSEHFSCGNCGLVLDQIPLLELAGIEDNFQTAGDVSDIEFEGEYGND